MADININLKVPAVEKLLDMTASGVGAVAAPLLLRWKSHEQAGAIRRITQAQAEAREAFKTESSIAVFKANVAVAEAVQASAQFQQEKRLHNTAAVVQEAKAILGDEEVPDAPVDHDFAAHFFDGVKDVSSAELQAIWARILAGEIKIPSQSSLRTLSVLKNLRSPEVQLFNRIARYVIYPQSERALIFDCFSPIHPLRTHPVPEKYQKAGFDYDEKLQMQEAGILLSDQVNWASKNPRRMGAEYCGMAIEGFRIISATSKRKPLVIPVIHLTQAGAEIARCVHLSPDEDYLACLAGYFKLQGCEFRAAKIRKKCEDGFLLEEWQPVSDQRK